MNRRGFIKITKKLDKKVPTVLTQKSYIEGRVDTRTFATNPALEADLKDVNEWISALSDKETEESKRTKEVHHHPMMNLPAGLLETVKKAVANDDVAILEESILEADFEDGDESLHALLLSLLQRSISNRSRKCIDYLIVSVDNFDELDDINARNCIHRLVLAIGKSTKEQAATLNETEKYIHPATQPNLGPKDSKCAEPDDPSLDVDILTMLLYVLQSMKQPQRRALIAKDSYGRMPLHYAAQYGIVAVCNVLMKYMIEWGLFDVPSGIYAKEWQDNEGMTPLHLAIMGGHLLTTTALLDAIGTKNVVKSEHSSAMLILATKSNYFKIVKLLVESGVDVNWRDENGETALHVAARFGHQECAKILLRDSLKDTVAVNVREKYFGWTPTHIAAVDGHLAIIELLIKAGADVNKPDFSGWNAREHAALRGHLAIARRLLEVAPREELSSSDAESSHSAEAAPKARPGMGSRTTSLDDRKSFPKVRSEKLKPKLKAFGHRYLTDETMIVVNLGSYDARKATEVVSLDKIPIAEAASTKLDTSLSLLVSASNATGDPTTIDLPVGENIAAEPVVFYTKDIEKVKLMFDIVPTYSGSSKHKLGRAVALLDTIRSSVGDGRMNLSTDLSLPVIAADTLEVMGKVNFSFLVITPFSHPNMAITESQTYWKALDTMVIGHRGLGKNQVATRSLQLGENTIESFITAANLGANYVEFDVQLTKDHVPVIYHDFVVGETGIDAPVHAMTLEQFLHVNHTPPASSRSRNPSPSPAHLSSKNSISSLRNGSTNGSVNGSSKDGEFVMRPRSLSMGESEATNHMEERMKYTHAMKTRGYKANSRGRFIAQPLTTLSEMFKKVPNEVGFNIELKYPVLHEAIQGGFEEYAVEVNKFCDTILKMVYDMGKGRNIMFSSFNPDVCLVMSFKQPNYPVLFLTDAGTEEVGDVRMSSLQEAIRFAERWNLLGIVSQSSPFVIAPRLVGAVKGRGLVCVSYGTDNNDKDSVKLQVKEGIDAVIVDSVLAIRKGLQEGRSVEEVVQNVQEASVEAAKATGMKKGERLEVPGQAEVSECKEMKSGVEA